MRRALASVSELGPRQRKNRFAEIIGWAGVVSVPLLALLCATLPRIGLAQAASPPASPTSATAWPNTRPTAKSSESLLAAADATGPVGSSAPVSAAVTTDPLLAKGEYLARIGDCGACHTVKGGLPYAGGLALASPFGAIYSTNITPDPDHGIGSFSYDDFAAALREGIAKDGHRLYPAMPYPSFSKIEDDDMRALYAFFMHGVKPAPTSNTANSLQFPLNVRAVMIGWDLLFRPSGVFKADPQQSAAWNRGAYLIQGLGHCGACHTPHGLTEQEKAFDAQNNLVYLSGNNLDGWHAGNLRSDQGAGLGHWSVDDLVAFFRAGRNGHTAAFGAMTEAVGDSTQYLTDEDLQAMATYLKALPAAENQSTAGQTSVASDPSVGMNQGQLASSGAEVYVNNCNACHRSNGKGAPRVFPELAGNSAVLSQDPTSLIHIVLAGSKMPSTSAAPAALGMPGFGWRLPDQEVADVLTFVRSAWGNHAPAVTADQVAAVRKGSKPAKVEGLESNQVAASGH